MRIDKKYFIALTVVHILVSASLLYFSQYFFLIFLQIIYFFALFSYKSSFFKSILLFLYLACLNYSLILIFSFSAYTLYFLILFGVIYFIYYQDINFTKKAVLVGSVLILSTTIIFRYLDGVVYKIYLYFDFSDGQNYVNSEILFVLTLLHTLILFFVLFKKRGKLEI
ncbi:MAG: hypothetical protein WC667_06665 [Sulfurimonas sp.]|jgi:hypothetical protein